MTGKPSDGQLRALREIERRETTQYAHINRANADECVDLGWAETFNGGYRLTDAGRRVLRENPKLSLFPKGNI